MEVLNPMLVIQLKYKLFRNEKCQNKIKIINAEGKNLQEWKDNTSGFINGIE